MPDTPVTNGRTRYLTDLLGTIFDRRQPLGASAADGTALTKLCADLMAAAGEATRRKLATTILQTYSNLSAEGQIAFFGHLRDAYDINPEEVERRARQYLDVQSAGNLALLSRVAEPGRQFLLRRLNEAPGATAALVSMRADLLRHMRSEPDLSRVDHDFRHLFISWFNRGFLVLRRIDWQSPASILEKIITYEAVHAINDWDDLRLRVQPSDRLCYAFFHPCMPDDPLIFVEVALTGDMPDSIQSLLMRNRKTAASDEINTATFYSISNCQAGLAGISFGNALIKQVVADLTLEHPAIKTFVTLSPLPGFARWLSETEQTAICGAQRAALETRETTELAALKDQLLQKAATYLGEEKRNGGLPRDPVARFHLANGAMIQRVVAEADTSANGINQSCAVMVNYLYELPRVEERSEAFANNAEIAISRGVRAMIKSGKT